MVMVAPVPSIPFWGHDDDADPLAGGRLYAFAAGTDTPLATYADPAGTTLNPSPVLLDDAGYANVYLQAGRPYKLRLESNQGVQQWEVDQVYGGGGGGGSTLAGVGWGKNTVEIRPTPGSAQAAAAVFPPDVLAFGMTVWVKESFGTSQGLQQIGLGSPDLPEAWGVFAPFAATDASSAGWFLAYGGQPQPASGMVSLTAYGGLFDGAGSLYVTGHFFTLTPGQTVGLSYTPGVPADGQIVAPQPPASETTPGILPLATTAETSTGTNDTDAVTPLKLKQQLDPLRAKVPDGTALSVVRYSAAGTAVEATPGVTTTSDGRLGVNATPGGVDMLAVAALGSAVNLTMSRAAESTGAFVLNLIKTRGTDATPGRVLANDQLGSLHWSGYTRNSGDTADATQVLTVLRSYVEAVDAQGRASGHLRLFTSEVSGAATEKARLTAAGNLLLGATTHGTGLTKGLVVGAGTDPTATHPADAVQAWVKDRGGVAGKGSLHVRTEDGTSHVLGDVAGHGTLCDATLGSGASYQALNVKGSQLLVGQSSVQERPQALIAPSWVVSTDATRTSRLSFSAYDATAGREFLRGEADGTAPRIGFLGANAALRQTLPAAATDATTTQALANALRTALITFGLGA